MRHFDFLSAADSDRLFLLPSQEFHAEDGLEALAPALGATLYLPATRPNLAADLSSLRTHGVLSTIVCLEDSIADDALAGAERNAVAQLRLHAASGPEGPLLFVRVRSAAQIPMIIDGLGPHSSVLAGFVLPKFTKESGPAYLTALAEAATDTGRRLLAMPVLESPPVIHAESRLEELRAIKKLLDAQRESILAVRIGATDFSSAYGLRRARDLSVYDVRVLADVISLIVNVFARADGEGYVVTGPVWEYFSGTERMFKPQLRVSPFIEHTGRALRTEIIAKDLDGLIREVALDKANGLTGKSVIHPSHVPAVHALSVVTHEEYSDAGDILGSGQGGGVAASSYRNKMNEARPHSAWATKIMQRAAAFGVARESTSFVDLLEAGLHQ
jgi:citrate lyase beta subunit